MDGGPCSEKDVPITHTDAGVLRQKHRREHGETATFARGVNAGREVWPRASGMGQIQLVARHTLTAAKKSTAPISHQLEAAPPARKVLLGLVRGKKLGKKAEFGNFASQN